MLRTLKIDKSFHDLWFMSDCHFHHNREFIYDVRGFKSIEDHDNTLIRRWNENCSHTSTVFHLGDFMTSDGEGLKFKEMCRRLSFETLYLMLGNHTSGHSAVYKETLLARFPDAIENQQLVYEVYPLVYEVNAHKRVIFLPEYLEVKTGDQHLVLCHFPIISHHKQGKRSIHICGHTHSNLELTHKDTGFGLRLDVGADSFGQPVNLNFILKHLKDRKPHCLDHHHGEITE